MLNDCVSRVLLHPNNKQLRVVHSGLRVMEVVGDKKDPNVQNNYRLVVRLVGKIVSQFFRFLFL